MGEETESLLISFTLARQGHWRTLQLLFVAPRSGNLCSSLEPSFVADFEQVAQKPVDQLPFSSIHQISDRDKGELRISDSGFRKFSPSLWRKHGRRVSSTVDKRHRMEVEAPSGLSSFSIPSLASASFRMHCPPSVNHVWKPLTDTPRRAPLQFS